jgi:splicing factor 3A subunit 3
LLVAQMNQHAAAGALDRMVEVNRSLDAALHDPALVAEFTALKGTTGDVFAKFYSELEQLRAYHQRFPFVPLVRARVPGQEADDEAKDGEEQTEAALPEVSFSGTESHGRHLDLHPFFDAYLNLAFVKAKREKDPSFELTYRAYVGSFYKFSSGVEARYKDEEYLHYVLDLQAYLVDFLRRAQPLLDVRKTLESIASDTQTKWDDGSLRSWGDLALEDALYCAPCGKQFTKQSVFDGHLPGKKHVGAAKKWEADKATREVLAKKVFFEEVKVRCASFRAVAPVLLTSAHEKGEQASHRHFERRFGGVCGGDREEAGSHVARADRGHGSRLSRRCAGGGG